MTPDEINSVIAGTQGWRRTQTTGVVIDGWLVLVVGLRMSRQAKLEWCEAIIRTLAPWKWKE